METSAKSTAYTNAALAPDDGDGLYDFTLAERYAQLSVDELERYIEAEAEAEVSSSAYEGIPLDKERIKAGLRELYQSVRAGTPIAK